MAAATQSALELTVVLPKPHAKQQLFLRSKAKRKIIRAGRRSGKTVGVAILAVENFLAGRRVLYATPTADQIQRFWTEVTTALEEPLLAGLYKKNETEHSITKVGSEARIRAKTAWNADTLRGDYADLLVLDEWQLMNEDAWEIVGAPMLIDNNGDAVFIYTPPSLHSVSVTKAKDLRHASKMFKRAEENVTGRWQALHFTSHDNPYVSAAGIAEIIQDMTALAIRQEIMAEDIDEVPGALWTRALIEETRVEKAPELTRVVVGVDPSGSSTNEAGVVASGIGIDGHLYVTHDRSLLAPSPKAWATAAVNLYHDTSADRVCGERNYGGDMVKSTIETVDPNVSYKDVNATRGKMVRAEPIAARFEKKEAHLVGKLPILEEEMCSYVPGNPSPNRMDAMVWTAIELLFGGALGLMEYYRSGAAAAQYEREKAPVNVGRELTARAQMEEAPTVCPECSSSSIGVVAGVNRCAQCGVTWRRNGAVAAKPSPAAVPSRTAYLQQHGR